MLWWDSHIERMESTDVVNNLQLYLMMEDCRDGGILKTEVWIRKEESNKSHNSWLRQKMIRQIELKIYEAEQQSLLG